MVFKYRELAKQAATPVLLFVLVVCVFATNWQTTAAQDPYQDERRPTFRQRDNDRRLEQQLKTQHFKSGAQHSELILKEISETLKSIDQRVERLEKLAELMIQADQKTNPGLRGRTR